MTITLSDSGHAGPVPDARFADFRHDTVGIDRHEDAARAGVGEAA